MNASNMKSNTAVKIAMLTSAAALLQGCVAAVVPLAAGGLLGGAAPNYRPSDGSEATDVANGTVEVQRSAQTAPVSQVEPAPAPTAELAQAAVEPASDPVVAGNPGLGTPMAPEPIADNFAEQEVDAVVQTPAIAETAPEPATYGPIDEPDAFAAVPVKAEDMGAGDPETLVQSPAELAMPETAPDPAPNPADAEPAALAAVEDSELPPGALDEPMEQQATDIGAVIAPEAIIADAPEAALAAIDPTPEMGASEPDALLEAEVEAAPVALADAQEPAPTGMIEAETATADTSTAALAPAPREPVRVIEFEPDNAFADNTIDASSVSAADAAAALSAISAPDEPVVDSATLARSAPQPEPVSATDQIADLDESPEAPQQLAQAEVSAPQPGLAPSAEPATQTLAATASLPETEQPIDQLSDRPAVRTMAMGPYASLINYANTQQSKSAEDRMSALLEDRASLRATRVACGGGEPTVLIDLDPEGETFDPTNASRAAPGLASALAQIRASGVKVTWISRNALGQIRGIRAALNRSGLDIADADDVLLMRYPEDRKQTRREDLAENACLVAIAGDVRTDFDELFEYLINPEAAATLDPLFENGWFLIAQPLFSDTPE